MRALVVDVSNGLVASFACPALDVRHLHACCTVDEDGRKDGPEVQGEIAQDMWPDLASQSADLDEPWCKRTSAATEREFECLRRATSAETPAGRATPQEA